MILDLKVRNKDLKRGEKKEIRTQSPIYQLASHALIFSRLQGRRTQSFQLPSEEFHPESEDVSL